MFDQLRDLIEQQDRVLATVVAVLCIMVGILVILVPSVLAWVVGCAGILAGVAIVATLLTPGRR